jgi:hypothetical protein
MSQKANPVTLVCSDPGKQISQRILPEFLAEGQNLSGDRVPYLLLLPCGARCLG